MFLPSNNRMLKNTIQHVTARIRKHMWPVALGILVFSAGWRWIDGGVKKRRTAMDSGVRYISPRARQTSFTVERSNRYEATRIAEAAKDKVRCGRIDKASKLFQHALNLDPTNSEILMDYGLFLEVNTGNLIEADHLYSRAVLLSPDNEKALRLVERTTPLVETIDRDAFDRIHRSLASVYEIPESLLKPAHREAYFLHIFHTNAIEGNPLSLMETRYILETGKSLGGVGFTEQLEVLGMDAALQYMNKTLLRPNRPIRFSDVLELHKRLLGHINPIEAGSVRKHQVFIGNFIPPRPEDLPQNIDEFDQWLSSLHNLMLTPIELAAIAHYRLVYIHPFYDGNGRTARLLMNLILMNEGYPAVIIQSTERLQYYNCLTVANDGDLRPFIRFVASQVEQTLEFYLSLANNNATKSTLFIDGQTGVQRDVLLVS